MWLLKLRRLVRHAGREALILFFAMRHPGTPMALKLASAAALAYVISPVDLVPDLPVIGWVDDAVVLGMGLPFLVRRLPAHVHADASRTADYWLARLGLWRFVETPGTAQGSATAAASAPASEPADRRAGERWSRARAAAVDVVDVVEIVEVTVPAGEGGRVEAAKPARARKPAAARKAADDGEAARASEVPQRRAAKAPDSESARAPRRSRRAPAPAA